jgi:hypothetical protein
MSEQPKTLGPSDEPQYPGAIVAVHYGDCRSQEAWIRSSASVGNWYCLGGAFGTPHVWIDDRTPLEKVGHRGPEPRPGPGEIPQHPHWEDVLARGPVTLLSAGEKDTYAAGWANGRRRMVEQMEEVVDDD